MSSLAQALRVHRLVQDERPDLVILNPLVLCSGGVELEPRRVGAGMQGFVLPEGVEGPVEDSVIAASLADLRAARRRIAVAHGAGRAPAVLAAVRAGLVDILVCDIPLRDALAELEGQ